MLSQFAFIQFSIAKKPSDISVIVSDLLDIAPTFGQIINPAVSDMTEIHPGRRKPGETQRGFHSSTFLVAAAKVSESRMNLLEQLCQNIAPSSFYAVRGLMKK